jgi:hypothetical protein
MMPVPADLAILVLQRASWHVPTDNLLTTGNRSAAPELAPHRKHAVICWPREALNNSFFRVHWTVEASA